LEKGSCLTPFPNVRISRLTSFQSQLHLGDILTHPSNKILRDGSKGIEIYAPDGRGAYFRGDGFFRGFVEENFR